MNDVSRLWDRRVLKIIGFVLLASGLVLSFAGGHDDVRLYLLRTGGYLAIALAIGATTLIGRALRNVLLGLAAVTASLVVWDLLSIESPFSELTTSRIEVVLGLAVLIVVPAYLIRELLRPKSKDFIAIEAAHKEARQRERELRQNKTV